MIKCLIMAESGRLSVRLMDGEGVGRKGWGKGEEEAGDAGMKEVRGEG